MTNEIIYVESQTQIARGEAALDKLKVNNDSRFLNPDGTITKVDADRWQQAQAYEKSTWMEHNPQAGADRNSTHTDGFGAYAVLPHDVGDVVELGCGVFTNLQYLLQGRKAKSVTLVDPLLDTWFAHANCTYKDGVLQTRGLETFPVDNAISLPIEEWEPDQTFDTVVMVNVLHHCKDADAVLAKVKALVKPGGYLVFHEPPREIDPYTHYDAGHPLSPSATYLEKFLSQFEQVYRNEWYFIGRTHGDVGEPVTEVQAMMMPRAETTAPTKPVSKPTVVRKSAPAKKKTPAKKKPVTRKAV